MSSPASDDLDARADQAIAAAVAATLGPTAAAAAPAATGPAGRRAAHVIAAIRAHRPDPRARDRRDAPDGPEA